MFLFCHKGEYKIHFTCYHILHYKQLPIYLLYTLVANYVVVYSYLRFFFFKFQTATSIGKNKKPAPGNNAEILFMTASWLMGVFVFALLIGDIRDIVGNARRNALSFQRHLDAITTYMNNNKVAKPVQVGFPIFILCTYLPFFICALPHIVIKYLNRK